MSDNADNVFWDIYSISPQDPSTLHIKQIPGSTTPIRISLKFQPTDRVKLALASPSNGGILEIHLNEMDAAEFFSAAYRLGLQMGWKPTVELGDGFQTQVGEPRSGHE